MLFVGSKNRVTIFKLGFFGFDLLGE